MKPNKICKARRGGNARASEWAGDRVQAETSLRACDWWGSQDCASTIYPPPPALLSSPPRSLLPTELIIDYPLSRTHQVPLRAGQPPWGSTTYWGVMSLPAGSRLWPPVRTRVMELRSVGRPLWCASVQGTAGRNSGRGEGVASGADRSLLFNAQEDLLMPAKWHSGHNSVWGVSPCVRARGRSWNSPELCSQ